MDGEVIIKAKMDTEDIDKGIIAIEKKLNKLKNKYIVEKENDQSALTTVDVNLTEEELKYREKLMQSLSNLKSKKAEILLAERQTTQNIQEQAIEQEKVSNNINKWIDGIYTLDDGTKLVKKDIENIDFSRVEIQLKNVGKSITKITKKIMRWGLALIGIRSIYFMIKSISSQVLEQDKQLKAQIEYIKYAIGVAIKPIIEFMVNLIYKIVGGVGAIIKLLFGINIFSKATANNFKNANVSAGKLKKTLAGFDEMNILNEDGSVGIGNNFANALDSAKDLSKEVDKIGNKIKKWFLGEGYNTLGGSIIGNFKNLPNTFKKMFSPLYDYIVLPVKNGFHNIIETLRPIWQPFAEEFKKTLENVIKPRWQIFKEFIINSFEQARPIWQPLVDGFVSTKNKVLEFFAPFINQIIRGLNSILNVFGININEIQTGIEETNQQLEESLKETVNPLKESTTSLWENLKQLASKTWGINIEYKANSSNVGNAMNAWFGNIKKSLNQIGIKFAKGGIIYSSMPKLASGGIINRPGRGVPIGGERGAEGVIPLTNSQQMALIGEAIGKYVTINATITNTMNGRVISKELQKINNESDFAYNR